MSAATPVLSAYAMCGLAFSGKSSAARRISAELGIDLVSLDEINHERGLLGGEGMASHEWERTSHIAMARLVDLLRAERSAVVDDTFSQRFLRDRCRGVAESSGARFAILYMDTPLAVIAARRAANDRDPVRHRVREEVFAAHRDGFQHPGSDEPVIRFASDAALDGWLNREKAAPRGERTAQSVAGPARRG